MYKNPRLEKRRAEKKQIAKNHNGKSEGICRGAKGSGVVRHMGILGEGYLGSMCWGNGKETRVASIENSIALKSGNGKIT